MTAETQGKKERYTLLIMPPKDARGDSEGRWQPERITVKEGWQEIYGWMRIVYIAFSAFTLGYNIRSMLTLPAEISIASWFGMSHITMPTAVYFLGSFGLLLYFIYRDLIWRSLSRYRLFMPFAVTFLNVSVITQLVS